MSSCCEPLEIVIRSLADQVNDLRVRINSTVAYDPRQRHDGPRIARIDIERDVHAVHHCRAIPGSVVLVDVFSGWPGGWRTSPWIAEIVWPSGAVSSINGGWASSGESIASGPRISISPLTGVTVSFGTMPAGVYRVIYRGGALKFWVDGTVEAGFGWQLGRLAGDGVTRLGPRVTYGGGSGFLGDMGSYATQTEAEAANAGASLQFTHSGGLISAVLLDDNYGDNIGAAIVLELVSLSEGSQFHSYIPNGSFTIPCPP